MRLNEIFSNGKIYKVPPFQRDYSWEEEHWEDLWEDVLNVLESGEPHYMGALIFKFGNNEEEMFIVDGQQRLVTLTIFAVAGIKFLEDLIQNNIEIQKNNERVKIFLSKFVGEKDATSLFFRNKLKLNRNDDHFFKEYILERRKPSNVSKLKHSQKLLYKCFCYFYEKIKDQFKNDHGKNISNLLENIILKKLIFIQITVEDYLRAYTVFETLNARGIELTPTDLLKNYLFSLIVNEDIPVIEEKWYRIVNLVGFEKFPMFLRYYLNSYKNIVRKERLYKELKNEIKTSHSAINLLEELEKIGYFFAALQNPYDEFWNVYPNKNKIVNKIEELSLFKVSQPIILLMSIYRFKDYLLEQSLRMASVISFRYNIIGKANPNELEKIYNKSAIKLSKGEISTARELFESLKSIYINDEQFVSDFSQVSLNTRRNKKIVKYILISIENKISGNTYDINDSSISIEHILPENPNEEWKSSFKNGDIGDYIYRLGNLTLLNSSDNRRIGNKSFEKKLEVYKESRFVITNTINCSEWNNESILNRQKQLAEIARDIWRLDF